LGGRFDDLEQFGGRSSQRKTGWEGHIERGKRANLELLPGNIYEVIQVSEGLSADAFRKTALLFGRENLYSWQEGFRKKKTKTNSASSGQKFKEVTAKMVRPTNTQ